MGWMTVVLAVGGENVGLVTVMLEVGGGHVGLMTVVSAGCARTKVTSKRFSRVAVLDYRISECCSVH